MKPKKAKAEQKKKISLETDEAYNFILGVAEEAQKLIRSHTINLIEPQQWLVEARIVNLIFQSHFHVAFVETEKETARRSEQYEKTLEASWNQN